MQVEEILGHLGVEGYCVVEGVIPADEIDTVQALFGDFHRIYQYQRYGQPLR